MGTTRPPLQRRSQHRLSLPPGREELIAAINEYHNAQNILVMRLPPPEQCRRAKGGGVAGVVGIEGGVVSGVINLESSGVGASDWRPRHEELYQEV